MDEIEEDMIIKEHSHLPLLKEYYSKYSKHLFNSVRLLGRQPFLLERVIDGITFETRNGTKTFENFNNVDTDH